MRDETYLFEIPKEGSKGLDLLDYCFNKTTQQFLLSAGLKAGMRVLEIGCGTGVMSCWIATILGNEGALILIDNNENQLNAARKKSEAENIANITFQCMDAYNISELEGQFDFIYCRFVLHHVLRPRYLISQLYQLLKPGGIAAHEEGIVNNGFAYPCNIAFGNEHFSILDKYENLEDKQRDGNFGIKLYNELYRNHYTQLTHRIIAPSLVTKDEKILLRAGFFEGKSHQLESGKTEEQWSHELQQLEQLIQDDSAVVGFYNSVQVSGVK